VSHLHELHVRPSLAPVYQYEAVVLGGHGWAPSNIAHRDAATGGAHTCPPPHPLPTIEGAQNRLVFTQMSGLSVGVPDGTHPPESDTTNALACTP
jgi:hypothetical protein